MEKYFEFKKNGTDLKTEIIAGFTAFLSVMYIIVINPSILSTTGMPFNGILTATVLVSAFSSIMMGIYAKSPIIVAPGMGLNAFFAYSVVLGMGVKWEVALGIIFWSGIIFLLLSIFKIRDAIIKAIPKQLRYGVASGIGVFIAFIGFKNSDFIISNPTTLTSFGGITPVTVIFVIGLFITSVLIIKKVEGSLIIGMIVTTMLSFSIGRFIGGEPIMDIVGFFSAPDFSLILKMDLVNSLKFSMLPVILVFFFTDMFDSILTFIGISEVANLVDEGGEPINIKKAMIVDSFATIFAGLFGTSSGTAYVESAAGIKEGGRTGLMAVVTGLLFLPFMFFAPLLSAIPRIATAPALVLVGVFMIKPILKINWNKYDDAIPTFLAFILIPLTYSITQGIIWSFLSWTIIKIIIGKKEEVSPTLIVIDIFAILALLNL